MSVGRVLLAGLLGAVAATATSAAPRIHSIAVGKNIDWTFGRQPNPARYQAGNVSLTIQAQDMGKRGQVLFARPRVTVQIPGYDPVVMEGLDSSPSASVNRISVGRWEGGQSYVLLQSHDGGAYCCLRVQVAIPHGRRLRVIALGSFDSEYLDPLPSDIDRDGRVDFVFPDDRFLYRFGSSADSVQPPLILNIVNGAKQDVSNRPGFRPLFQKAMRESRRGCLRRDRPNGACAAYVASAARVGQLNQAWPEMLKAYDQKTWRYPHELRQFLIKYDFVRQ